MKHHRSLLWSNIQQKISISASLCCSGNHNKYRGSVACKGTHGSVEDNKCVTWRIKKISDSLWTAENLSLNRETLWAASKWRCPEVDYFFVLGTSNASDLMWLNDVCWPMDVSSCSLLIFAVLHLQSCHGSTIYIILAGFKVINCVGVLKSRWLLYIVAAMSEADMQISASTFDDHLLSNYTFAWRAFNSIQNPS